MEHNRGNAVVHHNLDDPPALYINGRFIVQQVTGVQRVAFELVGQIDAMMGRGELAARVVLLVPRGRWVQHLALKHIEVRVIGRSSGLWWEQVELARYVGAVPLLCLGNTAPVWTLLRRGQTPTPRAVPQPAPMPGSAAVSVMIHDVSYRNHARAYRLGYRVIHRLMLPLLLRRAQTVITVSHTESGRLQRIEPRVLARTLVAQNGGWSASDGSPQQHRHLPADGFALYVGSLSHRKNFDRILATAIDLARDDGIDFVFVGSSGTVLRAPRMDVPADVAHRIHFLGQINDRDLLGRIYAAAGVLVFPSLYEASPLPPIEAAHFNCPTVASNIPSMWERCGRNAIYCDPRSVPSIKRAVRTALLDPAARAFLVQGLQGLAAGYSWSEQAETICHHILPGHMTRLGAGPAAQADAAIATAVQPPVASGRRAAG
ncbi:MAG: hypothetical protein RLZZ08_142 [Pseudomonadota bacterium]|jgi:glycosyltransferase involved in cell wall biosynthesis